MKTQTATVFLAAGLLSACSAPVPPQTPTAPSASASAVQAIDADCPSGTVEWGKVSSRPVIVAISEKYRAPAGNFMRIPLKTVAEVRTSFTADRVVGRMAPDLLRSFSRKTGDELGAMETAYTDFDTVDEFSPNGEVTGVSYEGVRVYTGDFTYRCAGGSPVAHGRLSAWGTGLRGSVSCNPKLKQPLSAALARRMRCG
ncbi:hypothetical protein Pth03_65620 [Planotetraspora thailandica]|uniref:Lipoprotein n=1 Tax=Planotetraspora thailandica TaxID=487172 RepID=A0A8J3XZS6_9ACTN|nr:hypothetical protein [Planotetraspora thailandica]GII58173.1 hypothetical protein Pth03_65620 [Planotetraspora thailandica]